MLQFFFFRTFASLFAAYCILAQIGEYFIVLYFALVGLGKNVHSICAAISRSDWVRSSYQPNLSKIRHTYCQHYEKQILLQLKLEALTYVCLVKQPFYSA